MKRAGAVALIAVLLLLASAPPSEASGRRSGTRVVVGIGPSFYWGSSFWWGPPAWYYPPPAYYPRYYPYAYPGYPYPRSYVVEQPMVYVQQAPTAGPLDPGYWYYCQSAGAYYPTASTCPEPWVRVPPRVERGSEPRIE